MTFRKLILKSGRIALAGKSAENNEELINQAGKEEIVLHTSEPGSPFVNIKTDSSEVAKSEITEAAIFCAAFSQAWKKAKIKKDVKVDFFIGKDIFKASSMKTGTFGVKKAGKILVKKKDILKFLERDDKKDGI